MILRDRFLKIMSKALESSRRGLGIGTHAREQSCLLTHNLDFDLKSILRSASDEAKKFTDVISISHEIDVGDVERWVERIERSE